MSSLVDELLETHGYVFEKTELLRSVLRAKYGTDAWPAVSDAWWELDFSGFSKGIGVNLSLIAMQELLPMFESFKRAVNQASLKARTLQADIDRAVAEIYGLTEAELALVTGT